MQNIYYVWVPGSERCAYEYVITLLSGLSDLGAGDFFNLYYLRPKI